ncbi:MAG: hypothetical protein AABW84_00900 [Nanoarchaeota archaeon]
MIYSQAPNRSHAETFGIMLATSFGAALAGGMEIQNSSLTSLIAVYEKTATHVTPIGNSVLVIANIEKTKQEEKDSLEKLIGDLRGLTNLN